MDSKKLSAVDPKLREAYQRIMNANISQLAGSGQSTVQQTSFQPPQTSSLDGYVKSKVTKTNPGPTQTKGTNFLLVLYVIGGIIFIAGYVFLWVKFFHFKLPFALPF